MSKRILVIGATGAQGGSVARHLLARGHAVRALTRTPAAAEAMELRALGADVVRGDLFDVDSVIAAMQDVDGVFGVTSYWEHFERERELGANLVEAAAEARVQHLVLSTLPHISKLTSGAVYAPHFDLKAETAAEALSVGIPTTLVQLSFYFENFTTFYVPQRRLDGSWELALPLGDARLAGFAVEDTGGVVAPILERSDEFIGQSLYLAGDDLMPQEYAAVMSRMTDALIEFREVPRDVFASYGFRGAGALAAEFEFHGMRTRESAHDVRRTRELYPAVQSFEQWARRHLRRLEQALAA